MSLKQKVFKEAINTVVASKNLRRMAVNQLDRMIYKSNIEKEGNPSLPKEKLQKYQFLSAILHTTSRNLDKGCIKPKVTRRVIRETYDLFHSRFCTISGGEPFMYKSDGRTIFDIFEEYR